jgi:pimeloyl-ACP methyl ester carboxylesterase
MGIPAAFEPEVGVAPETGLPCLCAGTGEAVVFLHGWGAFKELWWSTLKHLAPNYQVLALDWPGHGTAEAGVAGELLPDLARLAIDTCAAFGLERVTLVGHSLGGNVAARAALQRPDIVARLVLVDAAIDPRHFMRVGRLLLGPRWGEAAIRLSRKLALPLHLMGARVHHEHRGGVLRPWARRTRYMALVDPRVLHNYLIAIHRGSIADQIHRISQPTLVVTGKRDPLVHPRQARVLAQTIPNAELEVIPRSYHTPMDERPAEFNRALLRFLERHPLDR